MHVHNFIGNIYSSSKLAKPYSYIYSWILYGSCDFRDPPLSKDLIWARQMVILTIIRDELHAWPTWLCWLSAIFDCFTTVTYNILTVLRENFDFWLLSRSLKILSGSATCSFYQYCSVHVFTKLFQNADASLSSTDHSKNYSILQGLYVSIATIYSSRVALANLSRFYAGGSMPRYDPAVVAFLEQGSLLALL